MFKLGEGFPICKMIELDIVRYLVSGSTNWLLHFGQIRSLVSISVYSLSSSHPVIVFCCSCLASSIFLGWKDLEYDSFSKRFRSSLQYAFFIRESCNGLASCRPSYSNGFGMMFGIIHHFFAKCLAIPIGENHPPNPWGSHIACLECSWHRPRRCQRIGWWCSSRMAREPIGWGVKEHGCMGTS